MSDSFTPTLDEVRDRYADARVGIGEWTRFDESVKQAVEDAYAEFDRMIAEVERAAAARALEEAAESFRVNTWLDLLKPAGGMPGLTRNATAITNWLRARAAEIRGKETGE